MFCVIFVAVFMFSYRIDDETELRLPTELDAIEIYQVVRENLKHLQPWMPWATDDYSLDSARDYIKRNLQSLAENHEFNASVVLNHKIVGQIGFHNLDWANKTVSMGYWLAQSAQGKGLMTRASKVFINYAFDGMRLNRVQINCAADNLKSRAIPERLGFKIEGTFRQTQWLHDHFKDLVVYSMLAKDWKNSYQLSASSQQKY